MRRRFSRSLRVPAWLLAGLLLGAGCACPAPGDPAVSLARRAEFLRRKAAAFVAAGREDPAREAAIRREVYALADAAARLEAPDLAAFFAEKLYRIAAGLYPWENRRQRERPLPVFSVNSHQLAARHWLQAWLAGRRPAAMLHFDTHADLDYLVRPADLGGAVRRLREDPGGERDWLIVEAGLNNVAQAATAGVFFLELEQLAWIKPPWAERTGDFAGVRFWLAQLEPERRPLAARRDDWAPTGTLEEYIARARAEPAPGPGEPPLRPGDPAARGIRRAFGDDVELAERDDPDYIWEADAFCPMFFPYGDYTEDWMARTSEFTAWRYPGDENIPADHFRRLQAFTLTVATWAPPGDDEAFRAILAAIPGEHFLLDIDLDYFACNGSPENLLVEPVSHDRPEEYWPGARWDQLRLEEPAVARRLDAFFSLLARLKAAGKTPLVISIADSTARRPFGAVGFEARETGGDHTPPNLALALRRRLLAGLKSLYPRVEHAD